MARVTVEDCVDKVPNRFDLVLLAAQRAREISGGAELTLDRDRDKNPVVALREIAEQTIKPKDLKEAAVTNLQKILPDDDDEIEQTHTGPESMLRLGLTEDIEFRLRWNYAWRFIDEADNEDSAQDMIMTFKLGMTAEDHLIPESALEIRGTAPTGGAAWSTTRVEFGLDYIYAWKLAEGWELYGSSGFATSGLDDFSLLPEEPDTDHFIVWSQSAALGVELTERTTLYVEWFGLFSYALEDDFGIGVGNLGVDYYVTDDFVVDFRIGIGLTGEADDFFSGIGGGFRM